MTLLINTALAVMLGVLNAAVEGPWWITAGSFLAAIVLLSTWVLSWFG